MTQYRAFWAVAISVVLLAGACAPAVRSPAPGGDLAAGAGQARVGIKTLNMGLEGEPSRMLWELRGSGGKVAVDMQALTHWRLVHYDDRVLPHPWLATELPSQEKGTWTIRPDGTMQTIYRIHRNVTWHDGAPLTARDFVFAWQVTMDPDIPNDNRAVARLISRIETPDDYTLVIQWSSTFPEANSLDADALGPLPVHLLASIYQSDKQAFDSSLWWTNEFVGVGPYRLAEWEHGSHLVLKAYEGFYRGRPKIDVVNVRFVPSPDTAVANMLAGAIDGAIGDTIPFRQALLVKNEWEKAGKKPVWVAPLKYFQFVSAQFRNPQPAEISDVRLRRALLHAIDRDGLVDVLFAGLMPVADAFVPATDYKWDSVKDVVVKHEFDPRRAEQLAGEVGWRRSGTGGFISPDGQNVALSLWATPGSETEISIIADNWTRFGAPTEQVSLSRTQAADTRYVSTFPSFLFSQNPYEFDSISRRLESAGCPRDDPRGVGNNRSCYHNPAMDRVIDTLKVAIDDNQQRQLYREWVRMFSEDLPLLPLYIHAKPMVWRDGVVGPRGSSRSGSLLWDFLEWDITR